MNLDKIISFSVSVVLTFAAFGKLNEFQKWILKTEAVVIKDSQTSKWGSPRFFSPTKPNKQGHLRNVSSNCTILDY